VSIGLGNPLPRHQRAGGWLSHADHLAMVTVKEGRDAEIGDAMDMHGEFIRLDSGAERGEMRIVRRIEGHRDMGVAQASSTAEGSFIGKRLRVLVQREIYDMPHADGSEARRITCLQPAGRGDPRIEPLPGAYIRRIAHPSPSTRAAFSLRMSGSTSSLNPTSCAAAIHFSGVMSGKSLPNIILWRNCVFA